MRNITERISSLTEQLDAAIALNEPKENAFITSDFHHNDALANLTKALSKFGRVKSSTTLPGLCTAKLLDTTIVNITATVLVETVDYHGKSRNTGGDPINAEVAHTENEETEVIETRVKDLENGKYEVTFRPPKTGLYSLKISVFDRPIKDYPIFFEATEHIDPLQIYGSPESEKEELHQPTAVAVDDDGIVYVVDTGNSRIKVLSTLNNFFYSRK